ncbi:hypothetical protein [Streptomyces sp. FH025]|uniref:hypothetical protein n=1 Tax=Streptomyces sp. FH025 TaxID=2815937 RepID=UPI001A9F9BDB|nr:hypothetical protein [Streptomyces sp. FH025]MBO1413132.1 hypothetical protein [Streptomyces sp. FH025]
MTEYHLAGPLHFLPPPKRMNPAPAGPAREDVRPGAQQPDPPAEPTATGAPARVPPVISVNGNVGIVAENIENLYLQDMLEVRKLDRPELLDSPTFARPNSWNDVWTQGMAALADPSIRVIIMVAPRGYGSTTLVHQLLAKHTQAELPILQLEPNWMRPKVSRIPLGHRQICQFDLKDPETDRLSNAFLTDLGSQVKKLADAQSMWVLNITTELWAKHWGWFAPGVQVIELRSPPEPQEVVERRLVTMRLPWLVRYVRERTARTHLSAMRDAVQAVGAAHALARQWDEFKRDKPQAWRAISRPPEALQDRALDQSLLLRIVSALGDWREELDQRFAHADGSKAGLPLEDRCLLLSLAVHRRGPAPAISKSARTLEGIIADSDRTQPPTSVSQVFAGRGLRQRLLDLGARVDSQDIVEFHRPGFDDAVLMYVWDNYEDMRPVLVKWLVQITAPGNLAHSPSVSSLTALALRHQDSSVLSKIREAAGPGRISICTTVMTRVLGNEQMAHAAWARLYRWADAGTDFQTVVVSVAAEVLADDRSTPSERKKAVTRLRRVAETAQDRSLLGRVLDTYRKLCADDAGRDLLIGEVLLWKLRSRAHVPGKIALLALMGPADTTTPWLFGAPRDEYRAAIDGALGDVFADREFEAKAMDAAATWLENAVGDEAVYSAVRDRLVPLIQEQPSRTAGMSLLNRLGQIFLPDGRRAGDDLWAAICRRP